MPVPDFSIVDGVARIDSDALRRSWWTRDDYLDAVATGLDGGVEDKRLVMQFEAALARVMSAKNTGADLDAVLARYLADDYRQHVPKVGQGPQGLAHWLRTVAVHFPGTPPPPVALVANSGLVSCLLHVVPPEGPEFFVVTMFRVRDGRLVEHWGGVA